jgi:hypothetical protein
MSIKVGKKQEKVHNIQLDNITFHNLFQYHNPKHVDLLE